MAASDNKKSGHKSVFINNIVTPKGRVSFPHLSEPDRKGPGKPYADDKFKVTLLMPKQGTDFAGLRATILKCAQDAWGANVIKSHKDFNGPFRDGDQKELSGYAGNIFITCKSKNRPTVVDRAKVPLDPDEVYGGCYARLVVSACSYESTENVKQPDGTVRKEVVRGVTLLLDAVQKLGDGEAFGGKGNAAAALPDDQDDASGDQFADGDGPTGNGASKGDEDEMFR